jgi:hypothetical protein
METTMSLRSNLSAMPLLIGLAALLGACGQAKKPASLKDTTVPAGFTWQSSQSVAVTLTAGAAAMPKGAVLPVQLQRPDGKLLFSGHVSADHPLRVRVSMPTMHKELIAITHGLNGETRSTLPIKDAAASIAFP